VKAPSSATVVTHADADGVAMNEIDVCNSERVSELVAWVVFEPTQIGGGSQ
jgi:hypothetical protein